MTSLAKVLAIVLAVAVVANFFGLIFKLVNPAAFWLVTIIAAITAYKIIPKLRKQ